MRDGIFSFRSLIRVGNYFHFEPYNFPFKFWPLLQTQLDKQ